MCTIIVFMIKQEPMDHTDRTDEFEILLMQYAKGEISTHQMQKLISYLETDISYHKRFEKAAQLYAISSSPLFEKRKEENYQMLKTKLNIASPNKKISWIWQVAASIAIIVCTSTITYHLNNKTDHIDNTPQYCNVEATKGSKTRLTLPDSTVINLNEGSSLMYDVQIAKNKEREVELRGEAYFEVNKTDNKTFVVHLGDINVEVLGTTFMVASNIIDTTATISLIEGSVKVFMNDDHDLYTILSPGEEAIYNKNKRTINKQQSDLAAATSWLRGRFVFTNKPLHEILTGIEKEYNVKFVIKSNKLQNEHFTGSIDTSLDIEQVLKHLDVDQKYRWTRNGSQIILIDRQP